MKGCLDGRFVHEAADPDAKSKSFCVGAARDDKSGDIILKIVNASFGPVKTRIDFEGTEALSGKGKAVVPTSASQLDENTFEEPTKVSPKIVKMKFSGTALTRKFPGNSFTVIRIGASGDKRK